MDHDGYIHCNLAALVPHLPEALDCEVTEAIELFLEIDEGPLVDEMELFLETGCKHILLYHMSNVSTVRSYIIMYMYELVRYSH